MSNNRSRAKAVSLATITVGLGLAIFVTDSWTVGAVILLTAGLLGAVALRLL